MKKLLLAAVLSLGSVTPAHAAVLNFASGDVNSGFFGNANIKKGNFTDTLAFTIAKAGDFASTLTSATIKIGSISDLDFTSVTLSGPNGTTPFSLINNGGMDNEDRATVQTALTPGSYVLTVMGVSGGRGQYGGNVAFDVGAVPEPATWGMMILGMGLVGGSLRRRRSAGTAALA